MRGAATLALLAGLAQVAAASAESRDLHRRVFTEGLQHILEDPVFSRVLLGWLDVLRNDSPCAEERGDPAACDGVLVSCRRCSAPGPHGISYPSLYDPMPFTEELEYNYVRINDVLEMLGSEAYLADHYRDWYIDGLTGFACAAGDYGCRDEGYAGLGHFCPGGCGAPGYAVGYSCQWAMMRARPNWGFWSGTIGLDGSAWDSHGYVETLAVSIQDGSLDAWLCSGFEEFDMEIILHYSPGKDYVEFDERIPLGLNWHLDGDLGSDPGDQKFPPVEYMGRDRYKEWLQRGGLRYLGAAAHALADAGQPMHLGGYLGNFHTWWEGVVAFYSRPTTWLDHWGRSPTCREVYGTPPTRVGAIECAFEWARSLVAEARRRAPEVALPHYWWLRGSEYYVGLLYAIADAARTRGEHLNTPRWIEWALREKFPPGTEFPLGIDFCRTIWDRVPRPAVVRDGAVLEGPPYPYLGVEPESRKVACSGGIWTWRGSDTAIPHSWRAWGSPCASTFGVATCSLPWHWLDSSYPPWFRVAFDAGGFRDCREQCGKFVTNCLRAFHCELAETVRTDPNYCDVGCATHGLADDYVIERSSYASQLQDQIHEQIDRNVAAALAMLYIAATEGLREPDADGDLTLDRHDLCPDYYYLGFMGDSDNDGIGDACDLCVRYPRRDTVPPRLSEDYNLSVGLGPPVARDDDGDDVGNRCDLCPKMAMSSPDDRLREEADIPLAGGRSWGGEDLDRDGIGDRCDNCELVPNRDQRNCNATDEILREILTDPPTSLTKGVGDACDFWPCIDRCMEHGFGRFTTVVPQVPSSRTQVCIGDDEPMYVSFCAAGGYGVPDGDLANPVETRVQGCYCTPAEFGGDTTGHRPSPDCLRWDRCPQEGMQAGRWDDIIYGSAWRRSPSPSYAYQPLYHNQPATTDLGLVGRRGELTGFASYYAGTNRTRLERWWWKKDLCESDRLDPCVGFTELWFKPRRSAWFQRDLRREEGNTYTNNPWQKVSDVKICFLSPELARPLPGGGFPLITPSDQWLPSPPFPGFPSPARAFADLLWDSLCMVSLNGCPWPNDLFFDVRGTHGGLIVWTWDKSRNLPGKIVGSKLAPGPMLDLTMSSIAFAYDAVGQPNQYWLFGGLDPAGRKSSEMWGGRRTFRKANGEKIYTDSPGDNGIALVGPGLPGDGSTTFFELGRISNGQPWPAARVGATLLCTGSGFVDGKGCNGLCPTVAVATREVAPPDGVTKAAGKLLLIGGEGEQGPLDDIWTYDETATWKRAAGVSPADNGPWPSGWQFVGTLPGAIGGLAYPGTTQVSETLWLYGGLNAAGASADLWRIGVPSGAAEKVAPIGAAPAARISPAMAFDPARNRLVMFGGTTATGAGLTDLWAFDVVQGTWTPLAGSCSGSGCPVVTGKEALLYDSLAAQPTVVADRSGPGATDVSWTLRDGIWETHFERLLGDGGADCNADGVAEAMAGARCGAATLGYPDFGRMRCDAGALACRRPAAPGKPLWEYSMPRLRALAKWQDRLLALRGATVEIYPLAKDGTLMSGSSIRLSRAGHDIAVSGSSLLVADGRGLSVYQLPGGAELSRIDTCGKARRVFADGNLVWVVGLRSVLMLDVRNPSAPQVLSRVGLAPLRDGLEVFAADGCSWLSAAIDRLCDTVGPCAASGRDAAAYRDGRLFLNLLGNMYVLDFRGRLVPVVSAAVPAGLLAEMAAEWRFLYGNTPSGGGLVFAEAADGVWRRAGTHDVRRWVEGVVEVAGFAVRSAPGRLHIAAEQ